MSSSSCPYISFATIAKNGNGFALYSVKWQSLPVGSQKVCVQYRVTGDPTWINANTDLLVDIYGNIEGGIQIILDNAAQGVSYDINIFNQCGSISYQPTFTMPDKVFVGNYLLDNVLYNICGVDPVTLYSSEPFDEGVIMYTDFNLDTEITGYTLIAYLGASDIYALNSGTGEVGAVMANSCNATYQYSVILGNNTGTICSGTIQTVCSDSDTLAGATLYTDVPLSILASGFDYVLDYANNIIYNLNNTTAVVGSATVVTCTATMGLYQYATSFEGVNEQPFVKLYTKEEFGKGVVMYTDYATTTPLTGANFIQPLDSAVIYNISKTTGEVGCIAVTC
jgi:hypothetical protein